VLIGDYCKRTSIDRATISSRLAGPSDRPGKVIVMSIERVERRYARGGDLSKVPLAENTPPADLSKILNVDSANPHLRALRIREGYLRIGDLPAELVVRTPARGDRS
jgi:hypothetical protein